MSRGKKSLPTSPFLDAVSLCDSPRSGYLLLDLIQLGLELCQPSEDLLPGWVFILPDVSLAGRCVIRGDEADDLGHGGLRGHGDGHRHMARP